MHLPSTWHIPFLSPPNDKPCCCDLTLISVYKDLPNWKELFVARLCLNYVSYVLFSLLFSCFASPLVYFIFRQYKKALFAMLQIFFVLRKKNTQISFLHVYHHATQVIFTWAYLKYLPGKSRYITVIQQ
jgi:hypothetical protein